MSALGFAPALGVVLTIFTLTACNVAVPAQGKGKEATVSALNISCEAHEAALQCGASGRSSDQRTDSSNEADLTDAVGWSTSNASTATVVRGRITANEPGTATITASLHSGNENVSASVLVVVDRDAPHPQVAYEAKGVVRELSNDGLTGVELTLIDGKGHARTAITNGTDGAFRFVPLLTGRYRLRAAKQGYRTAEREVSVPDEAPLTLVLLSEPK